MLTNQMPLEMEPSHWSHFLVWKYKNKINAQDPMEQILYNTTNFGNFWPIRCLKLKWSLLIGRIFWSENTKNLNAQDPMKQILYDTTNFGKFRPIRCLELKWSLLIGQDFWCENTKKIKCSGPHETDSVWYH